MGTACCDTTACAHIAGCIDPGSRRVYPPHLLYKWGAEPGVTRGLGVLRCGLCWLLVIGESR
jgi:hypothetical protein